MGKRMGRGTQGPLADRVERQYTSNGRLSFSISGTRSRPSPPRYRAAVGVQYRVIPTVQIACRSPDGAPWRGASAPSTPNAVFRPTEMCRFIPNCRLGDSCSFAHSQKELTYKTKLCEPFMQDGMCKYGDRCSYAHSEQELPQPLRPRSDHIQSRTPRARLEFFKHGAAGSAGHQDRAAPAPAPPAAATAPLPTVPALPTPVASEAARSHDVAAQVRRAPSDSSASTEETAPKRRRIVHQRDDPPGKDVELALRRLAVKMGRARRPKRHARPRRGTAGDVPASPSASSDGVGEPRDRARSRERRRRHAPADQEAQDAAPAGAPAQQSAEQKAEVAPWLRGLGALRSRWPEKGETVAVLGLAGELAHYNGKTGVLKQRVRDDDKRNLAVVSLGRGSCVTLPAHGVALPEDEGLE
eukprot:TRINITY_DN10286_c0_g1_i1.p1 TRINITY_DN10286_c0_g1~~TRINITY_DN10286_c0_g1_i1.p1  ORF type:complete len:413 (+),score=45.05 TRINITY_DN10286_c0_g1_i1:84-1322(+)